MPGPSLRVLAVVAAVALGGVALTGCGDDSGLLPTSRASELQDDLDAVGSAVADGRCDAAQTALSQVRGDLVNLPDGTDPDLRRRLQEGVANLGRRVPEACTPGAQAEPATPSQPEEPTPSDTSTDETQPPETTTEKTQPPDTTTEETQPPDTGTGTGETQPGTGTGTDGGGTGGASPGDGGG